MITINECAWYVVVTLRDSCLDNHLSNLRKFYPLLPVYVVDNNAGYYNIDTIAKNYSATVINNGQDILSLTSNQIKHSRQLFQSHRALCFSSDDVQVLAGGFIEQALAKINNGSEIVSFSTDRDPVSYIYTEKFFQEVGFNSTLLGKENTDTDLIKRTKSHYGELESVGEYWISTAPGWSSRYVLNPHDGVMGKTDVNRDLEKLGLDSGCLSNRDRI